MESTCSDKNKLSLPIPRFRGNAIEKNGKWGWEMLMSFMGDGDEGIVFHSTKDYLSKEESIKNMMKVVREVTDMMLNEMGSKEKIEEFIDMNTNEKKRFDRKDEH